MKDPPPQKAGNSRDGGSIETAEGMEVSHAMWKVKQAATAGQDATATVVPPDAIAQARAWEEGRHDVPIDIGSDSDEEGPAPLQKPAEARVHIEYAPDKVRRIFHEAELGLARDAQQGMDDLHGRRGPKGARPTHVEHTWNTHGTPVEHVWNPTRHLSDMWL